jgi:hypothetical protein
VRVFSSPPWAVIRVEKAVESLFHVLEKNKNCAESGPRKQCRPALGLNF